MDQELWDRVKELTHDAIDEGDDRLLYELREYFDHAYQEAVMVSRERDSRRAHTTTADRQRECRKIQEHSLDEILEDL